jgi:hypothetical protein
VTTPRKARILSEIAWTHLRHEDSALASRYFLDTVEAYTDVASVRGVGLSLIGLAATEAVELRRRRCMSRHRPAKRADFGLSWIARRSRDLASTTFPSLVSNRADRYQIRQSVGSCAIAFEIQSSAAP